MVNLLSKHDMLPKFNLSLTLKRTGWEARIVGSQGSCVIIIMRVGSVWLHFFVCWEVGRGRGCASHRWDGEWGQNSYLCFLWQTHCRLSSLTFQLWRSCRSSRSFCLPRPCEERWHGSTGRVTRIPSPGGIKCHLATTPHPHRHD